MNRPADPAPPLLERISDYVAWYAERTPEAEAWVVGSQRANYRELRERVDTLARALIAAGVAPGDRVATLATPHPDFWTLFLASASIGAIWLGLNPRYRREEYRYVLADSEPALLFARTRIDERDYTEDLAALHAAVPQLGRLIALGDDPPPADAQSLEAFVAAGRLVDDEALARRRAAVAADDPALIVYTSGSTGPPKGALLPHHGLARCCRNQAAAWPAAPVRVQNFLPINHVGCVGDLSCWALVTGGCVVFLERFEPAAALAQMQRERCTVWGGVPTTFLMCLAVPDFARHDLSGLQLIVWSGAAAPAELVRQLARLGPPLSNSYGLTETVGSVTFAPPGHDVEALTGSVGRAVADYELRLVDAEGRPVSRGDAGEVQVRGRFLMRGYWRRPEATAEALGPDGWLRTGDLAVERPDGALRLVGRLTEIYKSGGYKVSPREVEQVLEACPGVALAAVVGVPDATFGEVGLAFVMREPGGDPQPDELLARCRERLANFKVPKRLVVVDELPLLPIGKVDRTRLRERARELALAPADTRGRATP